MLLSDGFWDCLFVRVSIVRVHFSSHRAVIFRHSLLPLRLSLNIRVLHQEQA